MKTQRIAMPIDNVIELTNPQNVWVSCLSIGDIILMQLDDIALSEKRVKANEDEIQSAELHLNSQQARHLAYLLNCGADISDGLVVKQNNDSYLKVVK